MGSKNYFNKISKEWDEMQKSFFSNEVREKAIKVAEVQKGLFAADIGAGTGFMTEELIKHDLKVMAIDQSEEMVKELQTRFADNVEAKLGFADNLPVQNESVHYVFANMFLHHIKKPIVAIREMVRILKPSGKLVITDADAHNYEFLRTEQHDVWLGFERNMIKEWYKEAGLRNIKIDCVGTNCCPTSKGNDEKVEISIFYALGIK